MHARAENVRRQILDEHGVVEWAADLIRDAENNGSVRLRPLLAFRRHLLAALLKCLLGFFGSLVPILETRPLAVSKHNASGGMKQGREQLLSNRVPVSVPIRRRCVAC
jgi:hypothetical protein